MRDVVAPTVEALHIEPGRPVVRISVPYVGQQLARVDNVRYEQSRDHGENQPAGNNVTAAQVVLGCNAT
jgi:hypothetical protein